MNAMTEPELNSIEQRRDRRFDVVQAAQLVHPDGELDCIISDFCQGGLFLRFDKPDLAIATLSTLDDNAVEITFSVDAPDDSVARFQLQATLKRLTPAGVGVAFVHSPTEALRALQKLRLATHRQRLAATPNVAGQHRLRTICTALLEETLLQTCGLLTRQLDDDLTRATFSTVSITTHNGLLSAHGELIKHAAAIQAAFVDTVLSGFRLESADRAAELPEAGQSALSLVDKIDFEDWLDTSAEITRLEAQFSIELAEIEPRIAQLFARNFDHNSNPAGPAVLCHAYRSAIDALALLPAARSIAYGSLRTVLSEQLASLYAELLALLPVSEVELARRIITQRTPHSPRSNQDTEADTGPGQFGSEQPTLPRSALGRIGHTLMEYFRGLPATPRNAAAVAAEAAQPAPSPTLQRLASASALPQNLDQDMQQSVEMFGALFDSMHAAHAINRSMRPFFGQLEASLVKLAIADPAFLASPNHPAHKVLNTLDRISMVAGDDGKITDSRLLRLMTRWTDRINAEAEKNPGVFDEARTQLERVVKPLLNERIARIARLQELCEGRQRAEIEHQCVLAELLARLGTQPVPNAVIELVNGGWRSVLLRIRLRHGATSIEAEQAWQVLELLGIWLSADCATPPEPSDVQYLIQRIDSALSLVCADRFAQDRLLDQLATVLFDQDKRQHEYTRIATRPNEAPTVALTTGQATLLEKLRVGDWLQFPQIDTPLNLIWIGDQPPVYVFATYRGVKKLDIKRADLLRTLETGEVRQTEDLELPLMDRSYSAMIQKMQRDLIWQSSHDPATGLANRRAFFRTMRRNWLRDASETGSAISIVQLGAADADGSPPDAGDWPQIMQTYSAHLVAKLGSGTLLARAGEHAIAWWKAADDAAAAQREADALQHELNTLNVTLGHRTFVVHAAIGLAWQRDCLDPERYYDNANAAATAAREANAVVVHQAETGAETLAVDELALWAHTLSRILGADELTLDSRAVVDSATDSRVHHELQPRLVAADAPAMHDLLHMAERLQRITEIDRWVLKSLFAWMREHAERLPLIDAVSVRLSAQSVANPLLLNFLLSELGHGDLPADKLLFEISEAAAEEGHSQTRHFMRQLHRHGCRFILGEFGTGASSFTTLKSMKLAYLKIDPALLRDLGSSLIDEALIRSVVETAHFIGIQTIAAEVGDAATRSRLRDLGVNLVHGDAISAVIPLADL
jgi:EAL domain-containing protein (putative c-di-GMP-specific phosphodiesterase class I)/GGDEF domain-containing protein